MFTRDNILESKYFYDSDGYKWKRNGKSKVYKTRVDVIVPVKDGLYIHGYVKYTSQGVVIESKRRGSARIVTRRVTLNNAGGK